MSSKNNFDKITNEFLGDLALQGISPMSITNYKSDLKSFEDWLVRQLKGLGIFTDGLSEALAFVGKETGTEYKKYLLASNTANSSLNRKLSTLRRLSKFLFEKSFIDFDFMAEIKNINIQASQKIDLEKVSKEFKAFLHAEKVTESTVKNYISDVKHFIKWFNENSFGGSK